VSSPYRLLRTQAQFAVNPSPSQETDSESSDSLLSSTNQFVKSAIAFQRIPLAKLTKLAESNSQINNSDAHQRTQSPNSFTSVALRRNVTQDQGWITTMPVGLLKSITRKLRSMIISYREFT